MQSLSDTPSDASHAARAPATAGAPEPSGAPRVVLDDTAIQRALVRIAHEVLERNEQPEAIYLIGIPNGGVPLARWIAVPSSTTRAASGCPGALPTEGARAASDASVGVSLKLCTFIRLAGRT